MINFESVNINLVDTYFFSRPVNQYTKSYLKIRKISTYELEWMTESKGGMYIDEIFYQVSKGDVVFRYPGEETQGMLPYSCFCIRFICDDVELYENLKRYVPHIIKNPLSGMLEGFFHDVFDQFINNTYFSPLLYKSYLNQLIYLLLDQFHPNSSHYWELSSVNNEHISKMVELIQTKWVSMTIDELAYEVGLSKNYIMSLFKQHTGKSINQYLAEVKLQHAKKMLVYTTLPITEIALQCGFENIPYFTNFFKKYASISPSQYRKKIVNVK
ncbi:MAG: helix-turn-helix transcriptional regulator [Sporolactobacillus sp.]